MVLRTIWFLVFLVAVALFALGDELADIQHSLGSAQYDVLGAANRTAGGDYPGLVATVLAAVVIFMVFRQRFNGWPSSTQAPAGFPSHEPMYFTTRVRYRSWTLLYGALVTGGFLSLVFFPEFADSMVSLLVPIFPTNPIVNEIDRLFSPSAATSGRFWALGASCMVIFVFYKSDWERSLRRFFQDRALIPREAEQLFDTLKDGFATWPLSADQYRDFLLEFEQRDELPTYLGFELNPCEAQRAQMRLEHLPRIEFMLWRMKRSDLPQEIRDRIAQNRALLTDIENDLQAFRAEVQSIDAQLVTVTRILLKHVSPSRKPEFVRRLAMAAGLSHVPDDIDSLPVSRLDDVIPILSAEFCRIADAGRTPARDEGPVLYLVDQHSATTRTIEKLEREIVSLRGLVPLCDRGLETLRKALRDLGQKLEGLGDATLRFAICVALATPSHSCDRFFRELGLRPRRGAQFDLNMALKIAIPGALLFVAMVGALSIDPKRIMETPPEWWQEPIGGADVWLLIGLYMILQPLIQGCYRGGGLASVHDGNGGQGGPTGPTLVEHVEGYATIWAVCVIGLVALLWVSGLSQDLPILYSSALAFTVVPPVWGLITATATYRVLDRNGRRRRAHGPLEIVAMCALIPVTLMLSWMALDQYGIDPAIMPWPVIGGIATVLTIYLLLAIHAAFRAPERETEPAPETGSDGKEDTAIRAADREEKPAQAAFAFAGE